MICNKNKKTNSKSAFSLLELSAVITLAGVLVLGIVGATQLIKVSEDFIASKKGIIEFDITGSTPFHYDAQNTNYGSSADYLRYYVSLVGLNSSGNHHIWQSSGEFQGGFQGNVYNDPDYGNILNINGGWGYGIPGPEGVVTIEHNSASMSFVYKGGSSGRILNPYINIKNSGFYNSNGSVNEVPYNFTSGEWYIIVIVIEENNYSFYVNGDFIGSINKNSNSSSQSFHICQTSKGNSQYCNNIKFAEILYYESILIDSDRKQIEKYLADKWSIPISHNGASLSEFEKYL